MKKITKIFTLLLTFAMFAFAVSCKDEPVTVSSISLVQESVPAEILTTEVDDKIDDIKINVLKSDETSEVINLTKEMISADDLAKLATEGTYTITVTYEGKTLSLTLKIVKPEEKPEPDPKPTPDPEEIKYSVLVKDIAGKPLSDFYVTFYLGKDIVGEGSTDNSGVFETELVPEKYDVVVESREGYILNQETFETDLIGTQLVVIAELDSFAGVEADPATKRYQEGDLMYDFTVYDINGTKLTLYDLLDEEKGGYKAVILNFWYTTCSACIAEFPYMIDAYESTIGDTDVKYSEEVAIITINNTVAGGGETKDDIELFAKSMGFNFYTALDYDYDDSNLTMDPALTLMFGVKAYPTTVIIDRYGLIAELEEGAVTATEKWTQTFDKYIAENYTPSYSGGSSDEEGGFLMPDVEQPDYSTLQAINGTNYDGSKFEGVFTQEDNKDAEYTWPWIVVEYDGKTCIKPSNSSKDAHYSFATVYTTVTLKKGEALVFDYFSSTEEYDTLYITVNEEIATSISGQSPEWEKSYCYVAIEDGEYEFGFCYFKDKSYSMGEDAVFITNMRIVKEEEIDKPTYVYRECASGTINKFTMSYPKYATVVYSDPAKYYDAEGAEVEATATGAIKGDGYYHVDSVFGPYLFADLLSGTRWNNSSLYEVCLEGLCIGADGEDYNLLIEEYAIYASNSEIGYTPVTKELADALKQIVKNLGDEKAKNNVNQWLEVCIYYSAYATNNVSISITGVCPWEPIMFEGNGIDAPATATGEFNRIILPRGLIFGFIPDQSGVYKFYGTEQLETDCWICDEDGNAIQEADLGLRIFAQNAFNGISNDPNFVSHVYLEAGKLYLFRAAFYDIYEYSEISVEMKYLSESLDLLTLASPGAFTSSDDEMSDIISGNYVDVELGNDGYYHVKGSEAADDLVYCDFKYINSITGDKSLEVCLSDKYNGFDFSKDELGYNICDSEGYWLYTTYNENYEIVQYYMCYKEENPEEIYYTESVDAEGYKIADGYIYLQYTEEELASLAGANMTAYVTEYIAANMITDTTSELYGCVKVDEAFAKVLSMFMDKYTFEGVEDSWLKLCYYYKHLGATVTE